MTAGDDLLRAIRADPDDDAARLVYADWLVERGDPLGEFIHVEVALARLPPFHPGRAAFVRRRLELFDAHLRAWWLGWFRWELMFPRFHRGFVEAVHFGASQDLEAFEHQLGARADHPLLAADAAGRFPLVRRFGGLDLGRAWQLAPELRLREAVEVRVVGTALHGDARAQWAALASVRTTRVFHAFGCTDGQGFDAILELPELAHLALENSRVLVDLVAERGIPRTLRALSVAAVDAEPMRAALAGRPYVENALPAGGELVLVTDPQRSPDLAFVEYPCVVAKQAPPPAITPDLRALEVEPHPALAGWQLRDELAPGDAASRAAHGMVAPERARPSETSAYLRFPTRERDSIAARQVATLVGSELADTGLAIADRGPVYCRVGNLVAGRQVLAVWRLDSGDLPRLHVIAGVEDIAHAMPVTMDRAWCNWVFAIPAAYVRGESLQLVITGERDTAFALYHAWFFQPA